MALWREQSGVIRVLFDDFLWFEANKWFVQTKPTPCITQVQGHFDVYSQTLWMNALPISYEYFGLIFISVKHLMGIRWTIISL